MDCGKFVEDWIDDLNKSPGIVVCNEKDLDKIEKEAYNEGLKKAAEVTQVLIDEIVIQKFTKDELKQLVNETILQYIID